MPEPGGLPAVTLRPTRAQDLDWVAVIESDASAAGYVGSSPRALHQAAIDDPRAGHYMIEAEDGPVGFVMLKGMPDANGAVELARIVIQKPEQGYGRAALRGVQRLAFEEIGAHRLWLDVFVENERARHVYRSLGFVEEGTMRDCVRIGGRYRSLVLMSMLEAEYRAG